MQKEVYGGYMLNTALCYIKCNNKVLMLHRTKKEHDPNEGKWIGIGGKLEEGESPEEGMLREVREETGITPVKWDYRGIITFVSDMWEGEYMHLFTAFAESEDVIECSEGELKWIEEDKILSLNLWEGDRVFLDLISRGEDFFSLKLSYEGDKLIGAQLNSEEIPQNI